jgi:hypothetical protein
MILCYYQAYRSQSLTWAGHAAFDRAPLTIVSPGVFRIGGRGVCGAYSVAVERVVKISMPREHWPIEELEAVVGDTSVGRCALSEEVGSASIPPGAK